MNPTKAHLIRFAPWYGVAVTILYFVSAFAINRIAAFLEQRARVPGMVWSGK